MQKTKLAHIQLLSLLSGPQKMMLKLLRNLDRDKYEIYVISKPDGAMVDKVRELGFHYIPIKSLRRNLSLLDFINLGKVYHICKKYKFDIVHTHTSKMGFLGRIGAKLAGVPKVIHTAHGLPFHPFQNIVINKFYEILEKFAALFCDKVVYVNNYERYLSVAKRILPFEKTTTIYNGVEDLSYEISKSDKKDSPFIVGTITRFSPPKEVIKLVKVAINICKKNENFKFIFVGDGTLYDKCVELVQANKMEERIFLPGWRNDIENWLSKFDVFILLSKWEGLPISILEAMAAGLPIIASNIKGNNELVSSENGYLVDVENREELEILIKSLPAKRKMLKKMGENSYKIMKQKFNLNKFIENYKKIYESN